MEEVINAMHEEAMHGYCNSDPDEMLFWNGRMQALADVLRMMSHDRQVQAYHRSELSFLGGGDEAAA